jgi:hypothetical protein
MALTNAERQARHRNKLKRAAAGGVESTHREAAQAFYRDCADHFDSPYAFALALLPAEYDFRPLMAPVVLDLLGLPADPWPGLTVEAVRAMIGKRQREADRRKLRIYNQECDVLDKMLAASHREWLLAAPEAHRKAPRKVAGSQMVANGDSGTGASSETTS